MSLLVCISQGEALYAMELALSLEKLNFQKLRELHAVAAKHEDPSMTDFIGKLRLPLYARRTNIHGLVYSYGLIVLV